MKGPWQRIKYDGRRLWACPVCQHRQRATGEVTSLMCDCQKNRQDGQAVWMTLVDEGFPLAKVALPPGPE